MSVDPVGDHGPRRGRRRPSVTDGRDALGFLTVIGGGTAGPPGPGAVALFPVVGSLLGLVVGLTWWGVDGWWPLAVAAAAAIVVDLALTGLLHVDGVADAGDGLLPPLPRERRLAVMADPHVGAFGVVTVVAVLLARFAALASVDPAPFAVAAIWATSRTVMALVVCRRPHARADGGLGRGLRGARAATVLAVAAPCIVIPAIVGGAPAAAAAAATAAGAVGVVELGRARLGGWTGDVLGAAGVLGETLGLVVLAGSW